MSLLVDEYKEELEYNSYVKSSLAKSSALLDSLRLSLCLEAVDLSIDDLNSPSRKRPLPDLRAIVFMLLWKSFRLTHNQALKVIDRDRTCSYSYEQKHRRYYGIDKFYTEKHDESLKKLKSWI